MREKLNAIPTRQLSSKGPPYDCMQTPAALIIDLLKLVPAIIVGAVLPAGARVFKAAVTL